jgi:hypothetical protein
MFQYSAGTLAAFRVDVDIVVDERDRSSCSGPRLPHLVSYAGEHGD